ncbi:hypothetical protein ACE1ET_00450 [Saccharicrinis sp. FJH62]|uniref:PKD domain-containing protein n=1 Tax=Saccharicrinis sp. FJH62 TaxID=3344657 RepID=UPI0035D4ED6C
MKQKIIRIVFFTIAIAGIISCKEHEDAPVSNPLRAGAGDDQQVNLGAIVRLDGSSSKDAENGNIDYEWAIIQKPEGSNITLDDKHLVTPVFQPDLSGIYEFELTINRGLWLSKDRVKIIVDQSGQPSVIYITEDITANKVLHNVFTEDWQKVDYIVTKSVNVTATLRIEKGIRIVFEEGAGFIISNTGLLVSEGSVSEAERIYFTGKVDSPGYWSGIVIQSSDENNKLIYSTVRNAGHTSAVNPFDAAVYITSGGNFTAEHCIFNENTSYAIYVDPNGNVKQFNYNEITGTELCPHNIGLPADQVKSISNNCVVLYGDIEVITNEINSGEEVGWANYSYLLQKGLKISQGTGLYLVEGTVLSIANDQLISCLSGGYIVSEGKEFQPVKIMGVYENPGSWKGILIEDSRSAVTHLSNTIILYAGSSALKGTEKATILVGNNGRISVDNSFLYSGNGDGIVATADNAEIVSFTNNAIRGHLGYPVAVSTKNVAVLDYQTYFTFNSKNQIRIDGVLPIANDYETVWRGFEQEHMSYLVKGLSNDLVIWSGLRLDAGVTIEMETGSRIIVEDANGRNGYLNIEGSEFKNVTIKNKENIAGSWYGIIISSLNDRNVFRYATILHGGKHIDNNFSANIVVDNSPVGSLSIINSTIGYGGEHGISIVEDNREYLKEQNMNYIDIPGSEIYVW